MAIRSRGGRRWHAGPLIFIRTIGRTFGTLRRHRLGALVPIAAFLLLTGLVMWVLHGVAPLAPFVYSLF